jgi:hypothetical protein
MSEIKYRHPANHDLSWSGKGRQPKWVEAYIANGGSLVSLDVSVQFRTEMDCLDDALDAAEMGSEGIDLGIGGLTDPDLDVVRPRAEAVPAIVVSGEVVEYPEVGFAEINQLIGQIQMANSFARFADVVSLQKLAHIKETKAYKASKGVEVKLASGEIADVGTWEGFCSALGMSVSKVDEDLTNLRAFGEQALENLSRIGAGYRELRQWRKLPQEQREALAQIATTGSKEDVLEAAYDAIEAERKKADELVVKNAELGEDLKLAERRAKNLDTECERKDIQIKRLSEAKKRTTDFLLRTEELREECMALQLGAELHLNSLKRLFEETDPQAPEGTLQVEQLWVVANTLAARALDLLAFMSARVPDGMPDRPMTQHMLTPEEAIRWLQDYPLIENRFAAESAVRESRREAARPKGPGRPKGSTNKAAEE